MNVLEIKNINKTYENKLVLKNINLNIEEGKIFGLIGLNGMGKTTLIKIILNLINADNGECFICGENTKSPKSRENIFYLPEKFQPSQNLKSIEFLKIFTDLKKINIEEVEKLCEKLQLNKNTLNKKISLLSKGMAQKIGLIASIIENKKLIILDEPMSGLDPVARVNLKNVLIEYKNRGNSIFFTSHILLDQEEICDEIAILNNSEIVFNGKIHDFKEKHKETNLEKAFLKEIL